MKHLFSFRQRPNETLTHSTTRGLNGSRMVVETTVKGRSNDCRPTLGRLSTLFLLLFALSFGFSSQARAGTKRIYCKMTQSWWTTDDAAVGVHYWGGSSPTTWPGKRMTSAGSSIWYYDIPDNSTGFQFVRVNSSGTIADWGAKTKNLSFDGTNNFFTITNTTGCWSNDCSCDGEWSKYAPNGAILGSMNSWNPTTNQFSSGSVTITLEANKTYEFKVLYGSDYYSNNSAITSSISNWGFDKGYSGNCHLTTAVAGNYTFTWNSSTKKLSVTYPTITHPSSAYYYVKNTSNWSQVNAHLFTESGIDTWPGFLPSSTTIGGETYYYFAAGAETKVIFSNDGSNQTPNITLSGKKGKYYDINAESWKSFSWSVTLNTNGGTINSGNVTSYTYGTGATLPTSSNISKTGYTFAGWYNNSGLTGSAVTAISTTDVGAKEYWAKWTANTNTPYTVKHYQQNIADDDYTLVDTDNLTGTTDAQVTPAVKSYTGFTAPSTQTKTIAADGSLVVEYKYTRNSHTLTWDANGGTIDGKATKVETLKYDATITAPQTSSLSYSGHNFTGWNTTLASTMPDNDVTYTAQWEVAATATVTYDGNGNTGGTVPTDATTYAPGATVTVSTDTPEKTGYNFTGWKNSDGGAILSAGDQFTISSSVTLTAQWEIVNYSITYTGLEGASHTNPATYTVEDAFEFTAPTAREGYTFTGWSPASITKGTTGNKTITASWTLNHHTLTWNLDGGSITTPGTSAGEVNYGTTLVAPVVEKTGYTFAGWSPSVAATMPDNNVTYTATWTENKTAVTVSSNNSTWGTVSPTSANVGVTTSATLKATPKTGYKFVSWALTGGAKLASGALTNAQITIKGDGSSATGTAVATFAEDLSSNWYLAGTDNIFPNGWGAGEKNMMKRATGHSTENVYYFTIHVDDKDIKGSGQESTYQFKIRHYKKDECDDYFGSDKDNNHFWVNQTSTMTLGKNHNNDNLYFIPTIAGDYEFKVDATNGADVKLTVTWPSYNCVYGQFNDWSKDANKLEFNGGNEASTVVNITDISKSYEFLVLVNSEYYTNTTTITRSSAANVQFAAKGSSGNSKFTPDIVGNYTFTYNKSTNKLTITYPALPTASTSATEKRMFKESELSFISGNGTEADPYKIYTDEAFTIDITALAARSETGIVAKYQFGEEAATTDVLTKTIINPSIEETSILVKAFYESDGVAGTAWEKTIWYQGVATPTLYLDADWSEAQEGDEVPENVTIYYNTANYRGPATVTRSKDGAEEETFFTVPDGTDQKDQTYTLPNKEVQRQTFVATATANGRTFTATKAVSIYRLVEITITDASHLMDHYYMWENGTNPVHEEAAWPGNTFFSTLGNAHIFYVKYPSYTHFVLNNGKASTEDDAAQTINVTVPDQSTCYTIGEKITTEGDDKGKYDVQVAGKCPNKLYVGDIDPVSAVQGEGVMVSPQVDIDPLLNENDLTISFNYGSTQGITCDQRGRSFMVTATTTGTKKIQVTYSIEGADPVTKDVTVNVTSAIMVQVKVPTTIDWNNHNDMWVYYFNHGLSAAHVRMSWKDCVDGHDRYSARVPLGSDGKVDFLFHEWTLDGEQPWLQTVDIQNVENSGCYTILVEQDTQSKKRKYTYDGGNCWTAYYVEIDMANGTVYRSNTVEDLTKQVSFFAPGSSEPQAKSGLVRIICNGSQKAVVNAATFTKSGIYTAKITANGEDLSDVASYTGDYYIRTDAAEGGWNDYVKDSHKFTYFTPYNGALYDYYWVMNKKLANAGDKLNIKACIGNGINENLANMIEVSNYTDGYGDIIPDAGTGVNLRFGYNPETNYFERSILRGSTAGESNFLNLVGENIFNDDKCTKELNESNYTTNPEWSKFGDISNWVYEKNVYVQIEGSHQSAQALLMSKAFNGTTIYQLGYTLDNFGRQTGTPAQRDILGSGTTNSTYNIRIIYDFKTNRIVSAWSPVGDVTYSTPTTIEADVLFVRHEDTPVAQVNLDNDAALVSKLNSAYFVMEIDGSSDKASESIYWFSVPFDCEISSIFGVEDYVTLDANGNPTAGTWGIQEYDGETRAQKGWYIEDTQTFWRWKHKSEKLLKGHGYILVFDRGEANRKDLWKNITREEPCKEGEEGCEDGKKTVTTTVLRLYFPSSESGWDMTRSGKEQWVEYEDWTCQKKDRKAQDSNWRLLGTNSYSNIRIDKETQFERRDDGEMLDKAPNFIYVYDHSKPAHERYSATSSVNKDFLSFNCYMVQFSGRINWNQYTQSEPEAGSGVAARRVVAENELTNAQMTLSLKKGNNTEDNTYIYMDTRATTDFDNQMDLTKITDTRANQIYSVTEEVEYAGNTLPVEDQIVPLTVNINANGAYTFAMPEMTDGLEVYLMDNATNAHIDMAIDSYTVDLNKGKIADRFYLDVRVKERTTPTIIETIGTDGNPTGDRFIKVIQNDQLHIIRNGRIYNASGMELNR